MSPAAARLFVRAVILLLGGVGGALIVSDFAGAPKYSRPDVPRVPDEDPRDLARAARLWEGMSDRPLELGDDPPLAAIGWTFCNADNGFFDDVNESAIGRIDITRGTPMKGLPPPPAAFGRRLEAALKHVDPRITCVRDGWRVMITTTDDLAAAAEMRAARAAAPPEIRAALATRIPIADFREASVGVALRHVGRVCGVPIDIAPSVSRDDFAVSATARVTEGDVGDVIERLLRRPAEVIVGSRVPRYRVTADGRIEVFEPARLSRGAGPAGARDE
jgi:hypothetical protein